MSTKDFLLPDLGEGLTEGEVVSWLVAVGDVVEVDQYVAEVETAKAVVEVPSPFAGTVTTLHAQPGEEIAVGAPLISIDVGGDPDPAPDTGGSADADAGPAGAGPGGVGATGDAAADAAPSSGASGGDEETSGSVLVGYGTSGGSGSRRARVTSGNGSAGAGTADGAPQIVQRDTTPPTKPPHRKRAKELGLDLRTVVGTGPDGLITRDDIEQAAEQMEGANTATAGTASAPGTASTPGMDGAPGTDSGVDAAQQSPTGGQQTSQATPATAGTPRAPESIQSEGAERVPMSQLRRAVTAQMTRSRTEIPEAVTWVEADATPLWDLRTQLNAAQAGTPDGVKVSALAIIMRMCVAALRRYPTVNASLDTAAQEMVLHRGVNLGFAAQTDRGLVVPVIHGADRMNILELATALNDLAETARAGKLTPAQMSGGTFTVSNYGAFGVDGGDMVINHPEAAILGTGRIVDKPWVVDGALAVRKTITYSIAFDHRIIDGGEGAGFVRLLADMTENPALLTAAL